MSLPLRLSDEAGIRIPQFSSDYRSIRASGQGLHIKYWITHSDRTWDKKTCSSKSLLYHKKSL